MRVYVYLQMAVVLLCLVFAKSLFGKQEPKHTSLFNQDWLKTLVSIEVKEPDQPKDPGKAKQPNIPKVAEKKSMPVGSAFLVLTPGKHIAMVTARHVVFYVDEKDKQWKLRPNLAYRLNRKNAPSDLFPETFVTQYRPEGWFKSDKYDVACRLMIRRVEGSDYKRIACDQFLTTPPIEPGAPVYVIGFPMQMRSEDYAMPILRQGMVARTERDNILLDAFVFPGNSGGPVVYAPTDMAAISASTLHEQRLVGLVSQSVSYQETAISAQTGHPRVTFEDNSGLCNVVPASAILELLESPEFKAVDMKPESTESKQGTEAQGNRPAADGNK